MSQGMTLRRLIGVPAVMAGCAALLWAVLPQAAPAEENGTPESTLAPEWQRMIGGYGLDKASAGFLLDNGDLMVAGETCEDDDGAQSDAVVIRIAADGTLRWRKTYGEKVHDAAYGIVPAAGDPQRGFFIVGDRENETTGGDNLWLLRIDAEGNELFSRDMPDATGAYDRYIFNLPQAADGGFFVAGQARRRDDRLSSRGFLMRFNAGGELLWQHDYGDEDGHINVLHNVRALPGGGLLAIGRSERDIETKNDAGTDESPEKRMTGWVMRLDDNGKVLWEKTFGGYIFQELRSFIVQPDGSFVMSGDAAAADDSPQKGWVLRLDGEGNVLGQDYYETAFDQACYDIHARPGGGYVVLCDMDHRQPGVTDAISLHGFDADGSLVASQVISNGGNDTAFRVFVTPEDDILGLGTTTSRPDRNAPDSFNGAAEDHDIWIFKINGKKFGF